MTASDRDLDTVLRELRSPDWAARVEAAQGLPHVADRRASGALVTALHDPENSAVNEAAADELLRVASPDAVDALLAALASEDGEVADHVREVLETTSSSAADEILHCHHLWRRR